MQKDNHPKLIHFSLFVVALIASAFGLATITDNHLPVTNAFSSSDLVSHWPLDNSASDLVGGVDGTLVGGSSFTAGHTGGALSLDGTSGYVDLGESFNSLTYPFTVSAWVRVDGRSNNGPDMPIFVTDDDGATYTGFQFMVETETPTYQLVADLMDGRGGRDNNRITKTSPSLPLDITVSPSNGWRYVAVAVGGPDDISLYVDCVDVGGTYSGKANEKFLTPLPHAFPGGSDPDFDRSAPARIGTRASGGGGHFNGLIDEVTVYNKKLSPSEVCSNASPSFVPTPVVDISANPGTITSGSPSSVIDWSVSGPVTGCTPTVTSSVPSWTILSVPTSSTYSDLDAVRACVGKPVSGICGPADIDKNGVIDATDESLFIDYVNRFDLDGDGTADLLNDLVRLKSCFFATAPFSSMCTASDLNADGVINFSDLAIFKANLGKYNFNGSSWFTTDKVITPPQTGSVNTGNLALTNHLFSLSCTNTSGVGSDVTSVLYDVPVQCNDGIDNDGDGKVDFIPPAGKQKDPGCSSATDTDERNATCPNARCERSLGENYFNCRADCSLGGFKDF